MLENKLPKSFGVIGLGHFGMALAKQLSELGRDVIVLDRDEEKLKEARAFTDYAYVCDNLTKEAMREAGIEDCDTAVICIGERLDTSILAALNAQSLGVPQVFAKSTSPEHGMILEKLGVTPLFPEQEAAMWTARSMTSRNLLDYFPIGGEIELARVQVGEQFVGQSVAGANFRQNYGLNIIALEHENRVFIEIKSDYVFRPGDVVIVIGKGEWIQRLEKFMQP